MTNEEKAKEIAEKNACDYPFRGDLTNTSRAECEDAALEMAEWKDQQAKESFKKFYDKGLDIGKSVVKQQFKEYLGRKMVELSSRRAEVGVVPVTCQRLIMEIINELFPEQEQANSDREE